MRLLLLCDGRVGEEISSWLIASYPNDVGAVVTVDNNKINRFAEDSGVKNFIFNSEQQISDELASLEPFDLGILAWWPKIISPKIIGIAKYGFINTHPSLLPYNRGKNYNFWALVEESPFGVSLHYVTPGIDDGDIVAQEIISYDWTDNGKSLYDRANVEMVKLFKSTYPKIKSGEIRRLKQDLTYGSFHYAREMEKTSRIQLDKKYTARKLLNLLRARTFEGHPGCIFEDEGEVYEVRIRIERKK